MERPVDQQDNDITQEPYRGPGAFVTGVGEGAVAHYGFAIGGMLIVGLATYIFHKPAGALVDRIRTGANLWQQNTTEGIMPAVKRQAGKFANTVFGSGSNNAEHAAARAAVSGLDKGAREALEKTISIREHGFGQWLLLHTVGLFPAGKRALQAHVDPRVTTSIAAGGMAGFLGFVFSPIYFMFTGAKHANDGKQQFERAKDEILTTRAERDALRDKYVEATTELEVVKASQQAEPAIKVAADAPPVMEADHTAALSSTHSDATHDAEHTEHTEGWAERMAERQAETARHEAAR